MSNQIENLETIYRVEVKITDRYYGPFTAGCHNSRYEKICDRYRNQISVHIKEPDEDGCAVFFPGMLCGVSKISHMFHWVGPWIMRELIDAGFEIAVYSVTKAHHGQTQVVFHPNHVVDRTTVSYDDFMQMRRRTKYDFSA